MGEPTARQAAGPTCSHCGRVAEPEVPSAQGIPLTWSTGTDVTGERSVLCDGCVREHARSIEGKLDHEWW